MGRSDSPAVICMIYRICVGWVLDWGNDVWKCWDPSRERGWPLVTTLGLGCSLFFRSCMAFAYWKQMLSLVTTSCMRGPPTLVLPHLSPEFRDNGGDKLIYIMVQERKHACLSQLYSFTSSFKLLNSRSNVQYRPRNLLAPLDVVLYFSESSLSLELLRQVADLNRVDWVVVRYSRITWPLSWYTTSTFTTFYEIT